MCGHLLTDLVSQYWPVKTAIAAAAVKHPPNNLNIVRLPGLSDHAMIDLLCSTCTTQASPSPFTSPS